MVKLTYCLRRKQGLSWDEFSRYWAEVHAPLVQERAAALGIKRYVQVRTVQDPDLAARLQARNGGSAEPFDGIAELWYESLSGAGRGDAAAKAARELLEDERNFIDLAASPIWFGEETRVRRRVARAGGVERQTAVPAKTARLPDCGREAGASLPGRGCVDRLGVPRGERGRVAQPVRAHDS